MVVALALAFTMLFGSTGVLNVKAAGESIDTFTATALDGAIRLDWTYTGIPDTTVIFVACFADDQQQEYVKGFNLMMGRGSLTFTDLENGKQYYFHINTTVFAAPGILPGSTDYDGDACTATTSGTPSADAGGTSSTAITGKTVFESYIDNISNSIAVADSGTKLKIQGDADFNTLPRDIILALEKKSDVSLEFSYVYEGKDYQIVIPAGKAVVRDDVPWYGPLYLYSLYGQSAQKEYQVVAGDTLSKIAERYGVTVEQLIKKNPKITDVNKIYAGMKINL